MATIYRDSDGDSRPVLVLDQTIDSPAIVQTRTVQEGVPLTDHRQELPRVYTLGVSLDATLGPEGQEDWLDWLAASQDDGLRLLLDDGRETGELVLGSTSETRTPFGVRVRLDVTERFVAESRAEVVNVAPAPRSPGDAPAERDDGTQATEEAPESLLSRGLRWVGGR